MTPATVEQLRDAYERSAWRGRVPFYAACTRPSTRAVLELGAALARRPRRPDPKQRQANDLPEEETA